MMGETSIRVTSAVAVEEGHLLALSKQAYEVLLKAQLRTDNRSKFLFLSSLPVLAPLHPFALESLCLQMTEREVGYGQVLFHEGEEIRQILIVHSGEFKLMKAVAKHSAGAVERRTRGKSEYKCITLPTKEVPFVVVEPGEILGDGEVLSLQSVYQQLCVCSSQTARVFAIDKRHYFKNLTADKQAFEKMRRTIEEKHRRRKIVAHDFLQRRSRQSQMNTLLNSNEWAIRPKEFIIRDKSVNTSISSLTSDELIRNDGFFLNELNKTFAQNTRANRFSIKKKCQTEAGEYSKLSPLIHNKKKDGVPHCVQDIVSIVKLKANFLRRFRKERRRERNVFKFDKEAVPLFIKSKYNKIQA
jgi:CRP-like cAMP-binding protein